MKRDELLGLIARNGHYMTYHEILVNELNKAYFDIESNELTYSACMLIRTIQDVLQNSCVYIHVGEGNKVGKMSYHIIVEVKMNFEVNKYIAELINARLGNICDLAVYKPNASFRLPNCIKFDK